MSAVGVQSDGFDAWNEQAAISRHLARRRAAGSAQHRRPELGARRASTPPVSKSSSFEPYRGHAAGLDAPCRRDPARSRAGPEAALSGADVVLPPTNGAYVQMPFEALLAVTAQESVAHRCVVIGEDLGTVPEGFREQHGRLGHLVVPGDDVRARRSRLVSAASTITRPNALVTFNTHDLSTYAGWRSLQRSRS